MALHRNLKLEEVSGNAQENVSAQGETALQSARIQGEDAHQGRAQSLEIPAA